MPTRMQVTCLLLMLAFALSSCTSAPAAAPTTSAAVFPAAVVTSLPPTAAPTPTETPIPITVTSTLDGVTALPKRIQWEVKFNLPPGVLLSRVEFLIDGQIAWVERNAPYVYGGDSNYLVTSFLKPGEHSFSSRVVTFKGQSAEDTVKAAVMPAADPPQGLANTLWTRYESAADIAKSTSGEPGQPGQLWLTINSVGWMFSSDPKAPGVVVDVDYPSKGLVTLRAFIEEPVYPTYQAAYGGAYCEEPDPPIAYSYAISADGKTLTLKQAEHDPCGDRVGAAEGTWTRSDK